MSKLTVIVPCYNVEKYLDKCLNSIINQTYNDFDIILIDDCSKDNTLKIIKEYSKKYKNIKYISNEENKGAGYSRNKALSLVDSEYVSFVDSDDYLELNYYEVMMNRINEKNLDILVCDIKVIDETNNENNYLSCACKGEVNKFNIVNNGLAASPCNKIIKRDLLLNYPFAEGIMNEDIASIIPTIINACNIDYTDETFYNYVQHNSSVQNSNVSDKRLDLFKSLDLFKTRIKSCDNYDEYMEIVIYNQIIEFFLWVPIKEKKLFLRYKFLKKFSKLSNEYDLINNEYLIGFLNNNPLKVRLYYKVLFMLNKLNLSFLTSLWIELFSIYKRINNNKYVIKQNIELEDIINSAKKQSKKKDDKYKISVVVPNYNYDNFIYQRIYSVLSQNYKIYELIILDDCSTDNSINTINELEKKLKPYINFKINYNKENSGSPFKQWKKGFEMATGDYIWIAEADDYCAKNMLKNLIKPIKNNEDIVISYCDTAFIDKYGKIILKSIKNEIDIQKTGHWNNSYVNNGINEINNYSYLNCTIANVSSCIIKNNDYSEYFKMSSEYRQAGDWLFYVNVMITGDISYNKKVLNYYRVHGNNVSSNTKARKHIDEINRIYSYYIDKFNINDMQKEQMKKRLEFLYKAWNVKKG